MLKQMEHRVTKANEDFKRECPDYESMIKEVDLGHLDKQDKEEMLGLIRMC